MNIACDSSFIMCLVYDQLISIQWVEGSDFLRREYLITSVAGLFFPGPGIHLNKPLSTSRYMKWSPTPYNEDASNRQRYKHAYGEKVYLCFSIKGLHSTELSEEEKIEIKNNFNMALCMYTKKQHTNNEGHNYNEYRIKQITI